jgi:hypothetical protein
MGHQPELPECFAQCKAIALPDIENRVIVHHLCAPRRKHQKTTLVGAMRESSMKQRRYRGIGKFVWPGIRV